LAILNGFNVDDARHARGGGLEVSLGVRETFGYGDDVVRQREYVAHAVVVFESGEAAARRAAGARFGG
jgi:hypothetical protein